MKPPEQPAAERLVRIDSQTLEYVRARATEYEPLGRTIRRLLGVDVQQLKPETKRKR